MHEFEYSLVALGFLVLICGLYSVKIESFPLTSKAFIALLLGIALGPKGFNLLNPLEWSKHATYPDPLIEHFCRITMGIALMAVALRLPKNFFLKNKQSILMMVLAIMPLMWISSAIFIHYVLGVPWLVALVAGAVITPTDPVLASTVVTGKLADENLPDNVKNIISAESGANDGLAYPFVLLPLMLLHGDEMTSIIEWLKKVVLMETIGGIVLGLFLGWIFGRLLLFSEKRKWMEKTSFLSLTLALTVFIVGLAELLHTNSILAVFCSGIAFDQVVGGSERSEEERIQESVNQFFTIPIFAIFGLVLPWDQWAIWGWKALALALILLLFRRLPFVFLLRRFIPMIKSRKEALFVGWFGPVGVAAFFYSALVVTRTLHHEVWGVAALVIFSSILVHGISGAILTKKYRTL